MPNAAKSGAEKLSALIAGIEAEAYARGRADAMQELRDVLSAVGSQTARAKPARGRGPRKSASRGRKSGGRRAPRGSVPRFVERVLRAHPGSTVQEIAGRASDETERSIGLSSIRVELHKGRARGAYRSEGRRWSLAGEASPPAVQEAAPTDSSPDSTPGGGEATDPAPPASDDAAGGEPREGRRTLGLTL